ncbi:hypothetical protein EJ08DRAFT_89480 [Tothia fuscella]|uniref:Uncharacterized protein n=1 Tax=Tothia fuscella TaxID=1048955 RepID=A0A9P4U1L6_9PEZI|nr:hypothetical protein EJ08DRAFT_89480 [Tothia fuscella]
MQDGYLSRWRRMVNKGLNSSRRDSRNDSKGSFSKSRSSQATTGPRPRSYPKNGHMSTARVNGPPVFLEPYSELSEEDATLLPPNYMHVRNSTRPEIAALIPGNRMSYGRPRQIHNATQRQSVGTSSNMTSLDDIRHFEIAHHIHMANRLSCVPQYPVYVDSDTASIRQQRLARPDSIASSGVMLWVAQLPGSEPFLRASTQQKSSALRESRRTKYATTSAGRYGQSSPYPHIVEMPWHQPASSREMQQSRSSSALSVSTRNPASLQRPPHGRAAEQPFDNAARFDERKGTHVHFADSRVAKFRQKPLPLPTQPLKDTGHISQKDDRGLKNSLSISGLKSKLSLRRRKP